MSIYGFRPGPTFRGASRAELFESAMSQPMSLGSTFWDQTKGGALESFGLGTAIRDAAIPPGDTSKLGTGQHVRRTLETVLPGGIAGAIGSTIQRMTDEPSKSLDENAWKSSPYYREGVPWDAAMTEDRAAALAVYHDAKKVREYYASKRPITSFMGNLAGQAVDPVNYIPVVGPVVTAAAVARAGRIGGRALTGAVDAAGNTAIAGLATREQRGRYGDDVSWQATVSEIATAALIGSAFGTIAGGIGARRDARIEREASERLSTLRTTQEARIALNEAIDGVVRGEDVNLSPNATTGLERIVRETSANIDPSTGIMRTRPAPANLAPVEAYHGTLADFERFDPKFLGKETDVDSARAAFFFSSDARVSEGYAVADDPYTYGIVGRLPRPLAAINKRVNEAFFKFFRGEGLIREGQILRTQLRLENPKIVDRAGKEVVDSELLAEIETAKAEGHDAVIFKNSRDPGYTDESDIPSDVYAVFDANKIDIISRHKNAAEAMAVRGDGRKAPAIDTSTGTPEPLPEGRIEAERSLTKSEDYKALASQYRVDPESGDFLESAEIEQLRAEGRLTQEDIDALESAQSTLENGAAYGEALRAAVACVI